MGDEIEPSFLKLLKNLKAKPGTAEKLWKGGITSAADLSSYDTADVKAIVNDPVLIKTFLPVLQQYAFQISMDKNPNEKAMQLLQSHNNTTPQQGSGLQSDATGFSPGSNDATRSTTTTTTNIPAFTLNGISNQRPRQNQVSTSVKISGGQFSQCAVMPNEQVVFNNQGATFLSKYTEGENGKERKKVGGSYINLSNGMKFSTTDMHFMDNQSFWLDNVKIKRPSTDIHIGSDCYPIENFGTSKALIINNICFGSTVNRDGAEKDTQNMKSLLEQLGFKVTVATDKRGAEIHQLLREFSRECVNAPMTLVYVGSHGERSDNQDCFVGIDQQRITVEELTKYFSTSEAPGLAKKPKLFFLQFCRIVKSTAADSIGFNPASPPGRTEAESQNVSEQQNAAVQNDATEQFDDIKVDLGYLNGDVRSDAMGEGVDETMETDAHHVAHSYADMLISYATAAGTKAYRDVCEGSWYVTTLSKVIKDNTHDDICSILTKVNNSVMVKQAEEAGEVAVQMTEFKTTLRKKVVFFQ
uniref:Uncharacterized LOC100179627 n=1 Tax=Ciona intestinalis TaxID=7719 RepID=F6UYE6_CIOIN|nr:uncharacterized protein LOC100179627 isoform X2 [Ciona intestinalis]|eukprot:XP_018666892.1 uncharacterized protein LOC100179627 isoform X2 [Ciona intestinalis]